MGSGDRSTPAKSTLLRNPRPDGSSADGKAKGSKPDETEAGKLLASRTVSIGEALEPSEKATPSPKASPQRPEEQGAPRPRMVTLPGGVNISMLPAPAARSPSVAPPVKASSSLMPSMTPSASPASASVSPPDSKRKLQPVPLPWQKPVERIPKPDPAVLLVGADETFLPAIEKA